jgi:hypothetical protein
LPPRISFLLIIFQSMASAAWRSSAPPRSAMSSRRVIR